MSQADHVRRKEVTCAASLVATVDWGIADGATVDMGQVLGTVGAIETGNLQQLLAPCHGQLHILGAEAIQELLARLRAGANGQDAADGETTTPAATEAEAIVGYVEYCIHPLLNGRTCMMCLAVVDENEDELDDERRSVNVVSHGQVLRLNVEEAKKFDQENLKRQLNARKLSLVLDLDHTLLHAVRVEDVTGEIPQTDDTHFFFIPGLQGQQHVVKLRPGLQKFLEELSTLYDLFIYTHGTRMYAEVIAKIIDPSGKFFQHRIVARTDTPDMHHKSLKLLFPSCDDSMIIVLDDRIDVWKENEGNVFLIEPYHFFKCSAEINNSAGRGVLGMEDETADVATDQHLLHAMRVLKDVHQNFYDEHDAGFNVQDQMAGKGRDIKEILTQRKRTILEGCHVVFSGLFPLHGPRKPESHYLWRLAVDLGAVPSMTMDNFPLTHLIIHPGRLDTQKHVQAKKMPNVSVVIPEWMLMCARNWQRVPETEFLAENVRSKLAKKADGDAAPVPSPPNSRAPSPKSSTTAQKENGTVKSKDEPTEDKSGADDADGQPPNPPAVEVVKPPPESILTKEGDAKKPKRNVQFSPEVDEAEAQREKEAEAANGKPARRSGPNRLVRRPVGARRVGPGAAVSLPENKGVVASGGTFDFLSKIKKLGETKRDTKAPATVTQKPQASAVASAKPEPAKDMDDAFLRLIEAEEEENAQEQKRKRTSTDLKDQLANRRLKRERVETVPGPTPVGAGTEEDITIPSHAPPAVELNAESAEEEDDEDLDDLEADILDSL